MPRKILIADDNAINRQMLINVLGGEYDVLEADNGREALAEMHRHYRLLSAVLLDIVMPEMDGYEVLRCARENALLAQIPIIIVTGSEDEESRVKALSYGANDFILKPFNPEIVKHCLRNNIALRETTSILNAIQKDKLTRLYNREAFFEKAGTMIRDREPGYYILSCFDIDNFKLINDQYGAAEGDRILKEIGNAVHVNMDDIGGVAGRISADNFAALFPAAKSDTDVLQRIEDKKLVTLEQRSIVFSIGRYVITDTSLSASAIYDRAYIAKQSVKGRYDKHLAYFDEAMLQKLVRDQQIVSEMEGALTDRQFEVWFQPQYNHVTGALTGAEALVRWRHPQKGIIPPGEFIPLFEQNGFIYELDKFVWREACRYLRKWTDEGIEPLPISVNISRYDIFRTDLLDVITGLIAEYGLPIRLLRLEITESAFAKSTKLIVDIVKRLIGFGFTVEIDDFGSGYSSLNTLKSVPAQVVKLDMRFLEGEDDAQRGGNILESIVRMTKWLGMSIIAEGVETIEQGDFLKSIGCSHVQGYLYARPMPAEEYEEHLRDADRETFTPVLETAENLNNGAFWNPNSIETLIFNRFVGSASIYEYHDGKIELLRATDKFAHMLGGEGMTVDRLLTLDLMAYLDPKTVAETVWKVHEIAHKKGEATGEFLFIDLPGCPRETYVRSTMRVIASADNRYLVYCISENITAQRLSEHKERQTARQLQAILDNINCGVTAVTAQGDSVKFLLANDKYFELLGYTRAQYAGEIGDSIGGVISPEDKDRVREIVERAVSTGEPTSAEYRAQRRDGRVVWLRSFLSVTTFADVEGPVQLCTYADITAEKNTAETLLNNLPCGAGICEIRGNDAHMTYLNRRYFTYFKRGADTFYTGSVYDVIHPDDRALLREAMRPALEGGGEGSCIVRIQDGQGTYLPFRIAGVAMEAGGDSNAIYVTFVPITHEELSFSEMLPVALEKMMASSTDLSFVKDRALRYICCSRAFAHMVGLESEKDVAGKTDYDLFDKALADGYAADDRRLMDSGRSIVDMVESIPLADGRSGYSSTSKYLLHLGLARLRDIVPDAVQADHVPARVVQQVLRGAGISSLRGIFPPSANGHSSESMEGLA